MVSAPDVWAATSKLCLGLCCACWFVILLLSEVDAVAIDNGLASKYSHP